MCWHNWSEIENFSHNWTQHVPKVGGHGRGQNEKQGQYGTGQSAHTTTREGSKLPWRFEIGEMEWDCMLGHKASATLRETYFLFSDPYKIDVCEKCRRPAIVDSTEVSKCQFCKTEKNIVEVEIPYAMKLLWQELFRHLSLYLYL